jgi:beta-lactamase class A
MTLSLQPVVDSVLNQFENLSPNDLAITFWDLSRNLRGSHRGDVPIYPASVVKLFYLEAAHRWMEEGLLQDTPELRRAMRDMIIDSSNDATHYIIDLLTGTTAGPELVPTEMPDWEYKRNAINRYFAGRGYANINVNQKTWGEGPYGRERVFMREDRSNRNALTTDATARLLGEIVQGNCVSPQRSAEMRDLLKRDAAYEAARVEGESHLYTAPALPPGTQVWSKPGWTTQTRHDAAYLELPDGRKFIIVVFTVNHSKNREIIPAIVRALIA